METIDVARSIFEAKKYLNSITTVDDEDYEADVILNMARNKIDVLIHRLAGLHAIIDHFHELVLIIANDSSRYTLITNTQEVSDGQPT